MKTDKRRYFILIIGGILGLVAAFLQTLEKLVLLENKNATLPCNISDVFSCSAVLNASQSALFGFPNSLICLIVFTIFTTVGVLGFAHNRLTKQTLYVVQGLAIFMLLFALWFLYTSTFVIGAICIFCLVCFLGLLFINGVLQRLNFSTAKDSSRLSEFLHKVTSRHFDIVVLIAVAMMLIIAITYKFYILS